MVVKVEVSVRHDALIYDRRSFPESRVLAGEAARRGVDGVRLGGRVGGRVEGS
jgi:hypothetical protein